MLHSSAGSDLDVVVVPFPSDETVDQGVKRLAPYLSEAEKAAGRRAAVVLPHRADYGKLVDVLVRGRNTTTERSRQPIGGAPVVAYCPTVNGIQLAQQLSSGWLGVIAWASKWFDGWARYQGAINARTGERYPGYNDAAQEAIEDIDFSGNNGWSSTRDQLTVGQARQGAEAAHAAGVDDATIYGAMVALGHHEKSIDRLMKIIRVGTPRF